MIFFHCGSNRRHQMLLCMPRKFNIKYYTAWPFIFASNSYDITPIRLQTIFWTPSERDRIAGGDWWEMWSNLSRLQKIWQLYMSKFIFYTKIVYNVCCILLKDIYLFHSISIRNNDNVLFSWIKVWKHDSLLHHVINQTFLADV